MTYLYSCLNMGCHGHLTSSRGCAIIVLQYGLCEIAYYIMSDLVVKKGLESSPTVIRVIGVGLFLSVPALLFLAGGSRRRPYSSPV